MLTLSQIDAFHRDGFLVLRGFYDMDEIELLRAAAEPIIEEGVSGQGKGHNYHKRPDGSHVYWGTAPVQERGPQFRRAAAKPQLLEAVGQCIGHPFLPINAALVTKLAGNGAPVAWHQDPPYADPKRDYTFEVPNFTVDIYLDRAVVNNGCLWGLPGHHLVGHVDLRPFSQEELFARAGPLEMEPGDVLFHALSSPHGSAPNTSASVRRILYLHFAAKEVVEDAYAASWTYPAPADATQVAESYLLLRRDEAASRHVKVMDEGFVFMGTPTTPPRHWRKLIDAMPVHDVLSRRSMHQRPL